MTGSKPRIKEPNKAKINEESSEFLGTFNSVDMDTQEAQDTIQASLKGVQSRLICHVPDFVWAAKEPVQETPEAIMTNGVLLFADVSGFTALTGMTHTMTHRMND